MWDFDMRFSFAWGFHLYGVCIFILLEEKGLGGTAYATCGNGLRGKAWPSCASAMPCLGASCFR
jgi:hypothetical protein